MYQVSNAYKQIMESPLRNLAFISASLGLVNNNAQGDAKVSSNVTPFSNKDYIFNFRPIEYVYATCEENQFKADGSQIYVPENGLYQTEVGIASEGILGAITISFGKAYDIKGLTVDFSEFYPTAFTVTVDGGVHSYTNNSSKWTTTDTFGLTTSVTITPTSMVGGQQRLRINQITMGVGITFNSDVISKSEQTERISFISSELPQLDLTISFHDVDKYFDVDSDDSFIAYLDTGQTLSYSLGLQIDENTIEWLPMASVMLTSWGTNKNIVTLKGSDKISFLDDIYSAGNTVHTRTLYDDCVDLFTFAGLDADEYVIDDCLRDITIDNPLPEESISNLLQMICNAGRCIIYQDRQGVINIRANFSIVIDPSDINVSSVGETAYSNPQNVLIGASVVYADCTEDFFCADGSMEYIPTNPGDYSSDTGFISSEVADANGDFVTNPSITLDLQGNASYYGLTIDFDGNHPEELQITTYSNGVQKSQVTVEITEKSQYISESFLGFDEMTIEFTKAHANDRVLVRKIAFGDVSDYKLTYGDILDRLDGYREKKVKEVRVKIYTFTTQDDVPVEVQDSVFETISVNDVGQVITLENPLIDNQPLAHQVAEWLANYYGNNVSYSCSYRGEPRLNASDIIFLDSDVLNNLQVEIEKHTLTFDGAFKGQLDMRRALRIS